jgi:glycolate oxidase
MKEGRYLEAQFCWGGHAEMAHFETIQEIVLAAYQKMTPHVWDHVAGGAESETTLCRNRQALDSLALQPRVMRDVSKIDTSISVLGKKARMPIFFAPIGNLEGLCPQGSALTLKAAKDYGILSFLSSVNEELSLEEASSMAGENLVFQLYLQGDETWTDSYLDRIAESSSRAFCLTADIALYGRRERDLINRHHPPGREKGGRAGFQYQAAMTWDLVDKARDRLDIPVIVKGIATAEDAKRALEHHVEVVYVSNHGGRQLDHGRGCADILPEIVDAVDNRAEILVDGGFLRGTDILKALAMGAKAVGIGKLQAWALAAGGKEGLTRMLEIMEDEITVSMALLGVSRLEELDPSYLHAASPVNVPSPISPFPNLEKLGFR